ncbi:MAG TPA: glycosyltransferase [Gemmatimonadales bacterium]|nr:glycosyltransferase [Gemmatimonadales bacterium]
MKVALAHDYLIQAGGAERVVAALHRIFPEAPIFTTIADPSVTESLLPDARICTSWMQRLPGLRKHFRKYVLLYPSAIESLDLSGFDLVISSSSAFAKGVVTDPGAFHLCYCHTPMRFGWNAGGYAEREEWGKAVRWILPQVTGRLRRWDQRTASRVDLYVANSSVVAERIERCYRRPARVIHPPVEVDRITPGGTKGDFFLVVSRLVAYKRVDLAIEAFTRMGRPLVVIGDGPARVALERLAGPTIRFLGRQSDAEVAAYLAACRALIFPGEEDFGIVPLEANAAGRPVIAFEAGGALDTVIPGKTGIFFERQSAEALSDAVEQCENSIWDPAVIREHAETFREEVFRERIVELVREVGDLKRHQPYPIRAIA